MEVLQDTVRRGGVPLQAVRRVSLSLIWHRYTTRDAKLDYKITINLKIIKENKKMQMKTIKYAEIQPHSQSI